MDSERVQVDYAVEDAAALVLQANPVPNGAKIVAQMSGARRLNTGKNTLDLGHLLCQRPTWVSSFSGFPVSYPCFVPRHNTSEDVRRHVIQRCPDVQDIRSLRKCIVQYQRPLATPLSKDTYIIIIFSPKALSSESDLASTALGPSAARMTDCC